VAAAILATLLLVSGPVDAQSTCPIDDALVSADDGAAESRLAEALERADADCAVTRIEARQARLLSRETDAAVIGRFRLRDALVPTASDSRFAAADRIRLVFAVLTPTEAQSSTPIDLRADVKLLHLTAMAMLREKAYGAWLDALSRTIVVAQRAGVPPWATYWGPDDPFTDAWKAGESARVLALGRQVANDPNWKDLRQGIGMAFFRTAQECENRREPPTAGMVRLCRERLQMLPAIQATGCTICRDVGVWPVLVVAGTVLHRSGAGAEAAIVIDKAIALIEALPDKQRLTELSNLAGQLARYRYDPVRLIALNDEIEKLRIDQYKPLFPPR